VMGTAQNTREEDHGIPQKGNRRALVSGSMVGVAGHYGRIPPWRRRLGNSGESVFRMQIKPRQGKRGGQGRRKTEPPCACRWCESARQSGVREGRDRDSYGG